MLVYTSILVSISPQANNVNEGSSLSFTVTSVGIPNNTQLYWTIDNTNAVTADFSTMSGFFTIINNSGSFIITPTADVLSELGVETFQVSIRYNSIVGTIITRSETITINDTSKAAKPILISSVSATLTSALFDHPAGIVVPANAVIVLISQWTYPSNTTITASATSDIFYTGTVSDLSRIKRSTVNSANKRLFQSVGWRRNTTGASITTSSTTRSVISATGYSTNPDSGKSWLGVFTGVNADNPFVNNTASHVTGSAQLGGPSVTYTIPDTRNSYLLSSVANNVSPYGNYATGADANWSSKYSDYHSGLNGSITTAAIWDISNQIPGTKTYANPGWGYYANGYWIMYADQLSSI